MKMPKKPPSSWKLAPSKYAFSSAQHRKGLAKGKTLFHEVLSEELASSQRAPTELRKKWVISEDFGQLRELWEQGYQPEKRGIPAPIVGHDVISLQEKDAGRKAPEPVFLKSKNDVVDFMMRPEDAYAFPVRNKRGKHLAAVIHVGPNAGKKNVRKLVKSLIKDPTGFQAYHDIEYPI